MEKPKHTPGYIPQIGVPEKEKFEDKTSTGAIYHKATSPVFFGLIIIFFFMPFINIKCGGQLVKKYSGVQIIQGDKNSTDRSNARIITGVQQSAYHQFEMARENFKWREQLKEDYDQYITDAPYFEEYIKPEEEPFKIPENLSETSRDPLMMRLVTMVALLSAIIGLIIGFWQNLRAFYLQLVFASIGLLCIILLQYYIKVTMPKMSGDELDQPMVTTEVALGYWLTLLAFLGATIISVLKVRWFKRWNQVRLKNKSS